MSATLRRLAPSLITPLQCASFATKAETAVNPVSVQKSTPWPVANSTNAKGDLRATSGLGLGDNKLDHSSKWMSGKGPSPMELVARVPPIHVEKDVVLCFGHEDPDLGHEGVYIKVLGHDKENPAVCKYCSLRYYQEGHH